MKRQRGRNRNKNNNRHHNQTNYNRSMDSQGPDVKVRGNASTIYEKYTALARDAKMGGSRVKAENLLQHAEHYLRVMNVQEAAKKEAQEAREKAEAERAAKRAERGETDGDESGDTHNRRNHRNSRRDRNDSRKPEKEAPTELDVIEPVTDAPKVKAKKPKADTSTEVSAEESADRRRKAPSRKKAPVDTPVEAAE